MKKLSIKKSSEIKGGNSSYDGVYAGFFAPVVGSIAISGVCMFLVESDGGETNGGAEWW